MAVEEAGAILLTQEELEERGAYWQKVLRLQDWRITYRIVAKEQLGGPEGAVGRCLQEERLKCAEIRILRPEDYLPYPEEAWQPIDMELTLVHELRHLCLTPLHVRGRAEWIALEQDCEQTAQALVALDREARRTQQEAPTS